MPSSPPLILLLRQLVVVCCFCCPFVLCRPLVRGSSSALKTNKFWCGRPNFSNNNKKTKKDRRWTKRGWFFNTIIIAPSPFYDWSPAALVDLSWNRWSSVHKLFMCTCTDDCGFLFFWRRSLLGAITHINRANFWRIPPLTCQFELLNDAEWHVKGGECIRTYRKHMHHTLVCHWCSLLRTLATKAFTALQT